MSTTHPQRSTTRSWKPWSWLFATFLIAGLAAGIGGCDSWFSGGDATPPGDAPDSTAAAAPITRIAYGSCSHEDEPQPLWDDIVAEDPDLWIWAGDNIYADTEDMAVMDSLYDVQLANESYQQLLSEVPRIIGTWDDHDYGANNAGQEYPEKEESQQHLLDFLGVPESSPRRTREGVYSAHTYGPEGQQVKVILLDTRYHRDPLADSLSGGILGAEQRAWFEEELSESQAQINIIVSSIQVIPVDHPYEKWANFPQARQRLFDIVEESAAPGVFFLSGDRHISEISRIEGEGNYPLYDFTSSGLTHSWDTIFEDQGGEENRYRVGELYPELSYATIEIDWEAAPAPQVQVEMHDREGGVVRQQALSLGDLQPPSAS